MKLNKQVRLEPIIKDPAEFTKPSINLDEISKNLDDNEESIFRNKYLMYLLGSSIYNFNHSKRNRFKHMVDKK